MKERIEHSSNDNNCCTLCKKSKGFSTFLYLLFPDSDNNPHIDGLCRCSACDALLAVPSSYYSLLTKLIYFIVSTLISICFFGFIVHAGTYRLLEKLIFTLLYTICFGGCSIVVNRIVSATAMYFGTWRTMGEYGDKLAFYYKYKEEKRFREDWEMKKVLTVLASCFGVCFWVKSIVLTIQILLLATIGFVLRFFVFKSRR